MYKCKHHNFFPVHLNAIKLTCNNKKTQSPPYPRSPFQMGRRLPYPIKRSKRGVKPNQRQRGWALEVFQRHYYYLCYGHNKPFNYPHIVSLSPQTATPHMHPPHPVSHCHPGPCLIPRLRSTVGQFQWKVLSVFLCLSSKRLVEWLYGRHVLLAILYFGEIFWAELNCQISPCQTNNVAVQHPYQIIHSSPNSLHRHCNLKNV